MAYPQRRWPEPPADAMDLHAAYVRGNAARLRARRGEEQVPGWVDHLDSLETLFLGAGWPLQDEDAYRFANACATWLRVLRGTAYWAGIELFVREALIVAAEFGLPDNSGELYTPLHQRFETDGRDLRKLPPDLLPARLLDGARCFDGPAASMRLPDPAANAEDLVTQFWAVHGTSDLSGDGYSFFVSSGGTPYGGLLDGLRALRATGRNGDGPAGLLKGLYAGLVLREERRLPRDLINRAIAWALGLPAESSLVPVVDVLLVSVKRGLATEEALGRLFGVRAFGRPVSEADREWRSSPGTALRRVAREMFCLRAHQEWAHSWWMVRLAGASRYAREASTLRRPYVAALAAAGLTTATVLLPAADPAQAATTLCGLQTERVSSGSYTVQSDEFNSSASECVSVDGQADFTVSSSSVNAPTNGMPAGYPSIYSGCHWGDCTETGIGKNPVRISSLNYSTVETTWEFTGPSSSGGAWDATYDVWINKTSNASAPNGVEMMVRLRQSGSISPAGSKVVSDASIAGNTYDIWWNPASGSSPGTVTYQMVNQENAVHNFSLQPLTRNAIARGYLSSSWYLADIEAGFEIWHGGTGLRTADFSVNGPAGA